MLRRMVLAGLFAALSLAGGAAADTFTDAGGRVVTIPDKVTKVVAAGPPAAVLIYTLAPEKLAGWVKPPSDKDKDFLTEQAQKLPVLGRLTGKDGEANIEAIRKVKPDMIIDVGTVDKKYVALADKIQKETGIPYVLIDGSLANMPNMLRQGGDLLDVTDRADKIATYAEVKLKDLRLELDMMQAKGRPRIYYGRGGDGLQTGPAGSINTEFIDLLGAVNVAEKAGKGGLVTVSVQQIAAWDPDIIILDDATFFAAVKKHPAWSALRAVKAGKVYKAPERPFGWLDSPPGVNRLMGVIWLEGLLYPKTFDIDVPAEVRDFYNEFYQVDPWDEELDEMFAGSSLQH